MLNQGHFLMSSAACIWVDNKVTAQVYASHLSVPFFGASIAVISICGGT